MSSNTQIVIKYKKRVLELEKRINELESKVLEQSKEIRLYEKAKKKSK